MAKGGAAAAPSGREQPPPLRRHPFPSEVLSQVSCGSPDAIGFSVFRENALRLELHSPRTPRCLSDSKPKKPPGPGQDPLKGLKTPWRLPRLLPTLGISAQR